MVLQLKFSISYIVCIFTSMNNVHIFYMLSDNSLDVRVHLHLWFIFSTSDLDVLISESMSRTVMEGVSMWKCHLCERSSKDKSIIRRHIESHFPGVNVCPYCGQPSKTRRSLQMHILNHHGPQTVQQLFIINNALPILMK